MTQVPLRWADLDAFNHVNNVVYLRYLQEARVDLLFVAARKLGVPTFQSGSVVSRHEIDYLAPLGLLPRPLAVDVWVREIRASRFTLGYELADSRDGARTVHATASTTLVPYDLAEGRPRRLSADERAVLEGFRIDEPGPRAGQAPWREPSDSTRRHSYAASVRFDDLDSYGHVNNVMFVEYLQEARIDFAQRYLGPGFDQESGTVVAGQHIDYLRPVPFRTDPLQVDVWVTRLGGSSFDLGYEIHDGERPYARAVTTLVGYDIRAQATRRISDAERTALEPFMEARP